MCQKKNQIDHKAISRQIIVDDIERTKLQISGYSLKLETLKEELKKFDELTTSQTPQDSQTPHQTKS